MTSKGTEQTAKPLENLTIEVNGNPVPALSSFFVDGRPMVPYSAPPRPNNQGQFVLGAKDSWFHKMEVYKSNLLWLLGLSHHKFWSQIVYGAETWDSVITFLQEAFPFYAMDNLPEDDEIISVYYQVYFLVFNVLKRAMTKKETELNYIGKKYGSLLYNYTIISVPMLIDICALYGERFQRETTEMVSRVFAAQPLYVKDLENSVQTIKVAFSSIEEKFTGCPIVPGDVTKLTDGTRTAQRLTRHVLQDAVYYLLDIAVSVSMLLETYKPAAAIFHKHKFGVNIARLYENVFPPAVHQVQELCDNDMSLYFTLMFKLNNARFYFLKLFRLCIQESLNEMTNNPSENNPECVAYLDLMTDCLTCSVFMKDYHSKFPIDHDLDTIAQKCPDFDSIKCNFLLESLMACFDNTEKLTNSESKGHPSNHAKPRVSPDWQIEEPPQPVLDDPSSSGDDVMKCQVAIAKVKDFLPHLGDGYILKCLEHYNMNPSEVINALLESNLPDELAKLDTELPFIPPEDPSKLQKPFNEEQFDGLVLDLDKRYAPHIGKKQNKEKDLKQLLDDKSFLKDCGDRFAKLGIIESYDNVYDDEYDDTYDDSEPPVPEVEEPDRKFVVPRVLQQSRRKEESEEDEEDDEDTEEQKPRTSYMNFVENPEEVRARYAQKRMANMRNPPGPPRDVVGNPKGKGQDSSVLHNRQQKTVHKSANRKKAAQFKKSKGMF